MKFIEIYEHSVRNIDVTLHRQTLKKKIMKNNNIFTVETIVNKYVKTVDLLNKDNFAHYTSTSVPYPYISMDLPHNPIKFHQYFGFEKHSAVG